MSLLKEVLSRKPIAESVNGIKLYRLKESLEPGTRVEVNGKIGTIKKELTRFSHEEPLYMIVHKDDKVSVAQEHEIVVMEAN